MLSDVRTERSVGLSKISKTIKKTKQKNDNETQYQAISSNNTFALLMTKTHCKSKKKNKKSHEIFDRHETNF